MSRKYNAQRNATSKEFSVQRCQFTEQNFQYSAFADKKTYYKALTMTTNTATQGKTYYSFNNSMKKLLMYLLMI